MRRTGLEEQRVIAIDDQHVPIAVGAAARNGAFDVTRLRLRFHWNRVARRTARRRVIALVAIRGPRRCHERLIARNDDVRDAVRGRTEIWMQPPRRRWIRRRPSAHEVDERGGIRIHGRGRDVLVPPVAARKNLLTAERAGQRRRQGRRDNRQARGADRCRGPGGTRWPTLLPFLFCAAAKCLKTDELSDRQWRKTAPLSTILSLWA